ncbi:MULTISPECIES: hypothetical protein [Nocardia]|nr:MULTISPECIES: hypothetical protein [Nocardia]
MVGEQFADPTGYCEHVGRSAGGCTVCGTDLAGDGGHTGAQLG